MTLPQATVSVDGIVYEWSVLGVLEGVALLFFLLGAFRLQRVRRGRHWVWLLWGFGLLLLGLVQTELTKAGVWELNYWPGVGELEGYAYDLPAIRWWEPYAWWGGVVGRLGGALLVVLGFGGAAREVSGGSVFGSGAGRGKGARA